MQIDRLARTTKTEIEETILNSEYYPRFKSMTTDRFTQIINNLIDTWKYPTFPRPADFKTAQTTTMKPQESKSLFEGATVENFIEGAKRVKWGWKQMDKIRRQVIPNWKGEVTAESCKTMFDFYAKMVEENKVWSIENSKWVAKANALFGEYFDPKEFGLPVKQVA